jgi:uncharacterized membrane protein
MFVLKIIFAGFFIYAGIMHFIKPRFFNHFIPAGLPKLAVNYIAGFIEFFLGIGLFFPATTNNASLGIFILLILFLPIHIWDATKIKPAIGSKKLAYIRIPLQFLLMYGAYIIYLYSLPITQ